MNTPNADDVTIVQLILNKAPGIELEPDGIFGNATRSAARKLFGPLPDTNLIAAVIQTEAASRGVKLDQDAKWGPQTANASSIIRPYLLSKQPPAFVGRPAGVPIKSEVDIIDTKLQFNKPRSILRNPTHVVIHHTANKNRAWGVRECHAWHNSIGWNGIGYNYIIDSSTNLVYYGRSAPQQEHIGSHVAGWNSKSIGICLTGHFSIQTLTDNNLKILSKLTSMLMRKHSIPISNLKRHSDLATKDCPGRLFPWSDFVNTVGGML